MLFFYRERIKECSAKRDKRNHRDYSHFNLMMVNCCYYENSLENDTITIFDTTRAGKHDARGVPLLSVHASTIASSLISEYKILKEEIKL